MGRPGKHHSEDEPRQYVGFVVPRSLKRQIEAAARANGRSLSHEAVFRLERSFVIDAMFALADLEKSP